MDAHLLAPADHPGAEAGRPAAANERVSPDAPAMLVGGAEAPAAGYNVQLAHSSQNPVTELPPSESRALLFAAGHSGEGCLGVPQDLTGQQHGACTTCRETTWRGGGGAGAACASCACST